MWVSEIVSGVFMLVGFLAFCLGLSAYVAYKTINEMKKL